MLKRGDVVQAAEFGVGIVLWDQCQTCDYVSVWWIKDSFDIDPFSALATTLTSVSNPDAYAFEAALALGDTAKALELYRALQSALEPFAAYGRLKLRYPDQAVFTLAYDRNGQAVTLLFSDFTHAAQLLPNAQARTTEATTGSAGGIALIAEGNA